MKVELARIENNGDKTGKQSVGDYHVFDSWEEAFSVFELYFHEDGTEDLRIIAANRAFAKLIGADYDTLAGRLFTDTCHMAMDWLPFYLQTAKTRVGNIQELYNQDLKKYLCCCQFSPWEGQVALLVIDRTSLWLNEQQLREKNNELSALFSTMTSGFCVARVVRDEQLKAVDLTYNMVNAAFKLLEGYPTDTDLIGKSLFWGRDRDEYFDKYIQIADQKTKSTFTKYVDMNKRILEVICFSQMDDELVCIENDVTERVKAVKNLQKAYETIENQNNMILSSIHYASKIQKSLLPREQAFQKCFKDYSILWKPRDIVGGDIYWLKSFRKGTLLCVCDCTGHGTPGALLTVLVASALEDIVDENNCNDTAGLIYILDHRIAAILNVETDAIRAKAGKSNLLIADGCDLVLLFIQKDGTVTMSGSNICLFVCDSSQVRRIRGQRLYIGEGKLAGREDVKTVTFPAIPGQCFYVASDGLYDQIGGEPPRPFGYSAVQALLLQHHGKPLEQITGLIWEACEKHRGTQARRDDVEMVAFQL